MKTLANAIYEAAEMKRIVALALLAVLAGCATVDGIGRDLSGASRGVQKLF